MVRLIGSWQDESYWYESLAPYWLLLVFLAAKLVQTVLVSERLGRGGWSLSFRSWTFSLSLVSCF